MKLILLFIFALYNCGESLRFFLHPNSRKCIGFHSGKDELVVGNFSISLVDKQQVDITIVDTRGDVLYKNVDSKYAKFSFVTDKDEKVDICFTSKAPMFKTKHRHDVELSLTKGIEAKIKQGHKDVAKLKPLESDILQAQHYAEAIRNDFENMKVRKSIMHNTNERTKFRVYAVGLFNLIWFLSIATAQVAYFWNYFKKRKLIE